MKRTVMTLIAVLATSVGCAATDDTAPTGSRSTETTGQVEGGVEMNVVTRGSYGRLAEASEGRRRAPFIEVAASRADLESLWRRYVSESEPVPDVSLDDSVVVFLLLPQQSTGGYGIEPHGVEVEGGTLRIDATLHQPGQGDITTQALTAPYAVIEIEGAEAARSIEWVNQGRLLASTVID